MAVKEASHLIDLRLNMVDAIAQHALVSGDRIGKEALDERVMEAMRRVPRHEFVPAEVRNYAYFDTPLPIGSGKTISQPFMAAVMTDLLDLEPTDTILEIGTGLGYHTAVLAELAAAVYTIEIVEELGGLGPQKAVRTRLCQHSCTNRRWRRGLGRTRAVRQDARGGGADQRS